MLHFTTRDLLWLTVVVALGAGWFVQHRQQVLLRTKQAQIQEELVRSHQAEALRARAAEEAARLVVPTSTPP